jgi:hypothetical protein
MAPRGRARRYALPTVAAATASGNGQRLVDLPEATSCLQSIRLAPLEAIVGLDVQPGGGIPQAPSGVSKARATEFLRHEAWR